MALSLFYQMGHIKYEHFTLYTWQDYENWDGDWELIEGIPYSMSPSAIPKQELLVKNIQVAFDKALSKQACDRGEAVSELDWRVNRYTVVRPDVMILCEPSEEDYQTGTAGLCRSLITRYPTQGSNF